jgi:hypothetical protein
MEQGIASSVRRPDSINLDGFSEIKKGEAEFDKAEYLIQMHVGSISCKISKLYSLAELDTNHKLINNFKIFANEGSKPTYLHSVIPVAELDAKTNSINDVINRGFEIPDSGVFVPCGISNLKVDKSTGEVAVLLCKVVVKRTLSLRSSALSLEKIKSMFRSQRFDSILVQDDDEKEEHPFKSNYILFNDRQILPTHLAYIKYVELTYGVRFDNQQVCEVCKTSSSRLYCENDQLEMCYKCDSEYHPADNKVAAKHVRVDSREVHCLCLNQERTGDGVLQGPPESEERELLHELQGGTVHIVPTDRLPLEPGLQRTQTGQCR